MTTAELPTAGDRARAAFSSDGLQRLGQMLVPILAALVVGGVVLAITGWDPLSVYRLMVREAFGSTQRVESTLGAATPLLFCGLATAVAFRAGVFNIGVDGSFILGGLAAAWVGAGLTGLPGWLLILLCLGLGSLVGALWSAPPALLRARLGVDEVVTTLMFNFVAVGLASWIVNTLLLAKGTANSASSPIAARAELPSLSGDVTLGFVIALAAAIFYGIWARASASGFELRLSGLNPAFAQSTGIPVRRVIVSAMLWSGLVGGLGGAAHALGVVHRFVDGFSPGYGFTGIAIALLARNGAIGVVLGSILFGALASAGATIQLFSDIPLEHRRRPAGDDHDLRGHPDRRSPAAAAQAGGVIGQVLAAATLATTPLLLAALGGLINRRGGIVNIALEGEMLIGAIIAVLVSGATGSWVVGLAAAVGAGSVAGLLFSLSITRLGANEIIAGLGFNILVAGVIGYALNDAGTFKPDGLSTIPRIELPVIGSIPIVGDVLSDKDPITYLAWACVPLCAWFLAATRPGLRLRAVGSAQEAAHALGLPALRIRDASTVAAGAFAGLAGGQLALGLVGLFSQGMVAGRGFIALAAFYFGRARPLPTALGCAIFALFDAIQIRLQQEGWSTQLVEHLPVPRRRHRPHTRCAERPAPKRRPRGDHVNPAMLVVDALRAFFDPQGLHYYPEVRAVEGPLAALLAAARDRDCGRPRRRAPPARPARLRAAQAARALPRRGSRRRVLAALRPGRPPARDRRREAALQRLLRDRPRARPARAGRRHGRGRGREDERLHPGDVPGRVRPRAAGRPAARGDELESSGPRRGEPGGRRPLSR